MRFPVIMTLLIVSESTRPCYPPTGDIMTTTDTNSIETTTASPTEHKVSKIVLVLLVLAGLLIAVRTIATMREEVRMINSPPPPMTHIVVPEFSLTRHDGEPFGLTNLKGKVWIADFIFTRCAGPCPKMTQRMASLQTVLAGYDNVAFVSFSVDPQHDTPEVLTNYAKHFSSDLKNWSFLTGDRDAIFDLCLRGFRLSVSEDPDADYDDMIIHSTKFALVDEDGKIRGYYEGSEDADITRLVNDVSKLAQQ